MLGSQVEAAFSEKLSWLELGTACMLPYGLRRAGRKGASLAKRSSFLRPAVCDVSGRLHSQNTRLGQVFLVKQGKGADLVKSLLRMTGQSLERFAQAFGKGLYFFLGEEISAVDDGNAQG